MIVPKLTLSDIFWQFWTFLPKIHIFHFLFRSFHLCSQFFDSIGTSHWSLFFFLQLSCHITHLFLQNVILKLLWSILFFTFEPFQVKFDKLLSFVFKMTNFDVWLKRFFVNQKWLKLALFRLTFTQGAPLRELRTSQQISAFKKEFYAKNRFWINVKFFS